MRTVLLVVALLISMNLDAASFPESVRNENQFNADVDAACLREYAADREDVMQLTLEEASICITPTSCDDTSSPLCQGKNGGQACGSGGVCVGAPQCYCNDK